MMSTQIFIVDGMTCKNCKVHVENGIKNIQGVEEVVADNITGRVMVKANPINVEMIKLAVEKSGYRFKGSETSISPGSDIWLS
jgi:copper chaperone CopZ